MYQFLATSNMCQVLIVLATVFTLAYGLDLLDISLPVAPTDTDTRIVGGTDSDIEDFPYQLSLQYKDYGHICGGCIISEIYGLTAAHCVAGANHSDITLRAGSSIRNKGGIVHQVSKIHIHPDNKVNEIDYDYAVIEVDKPFRLNTPGINFIPLTDVEPSQCNCNISGWGTTSSGGSLPEQLKSAEVPIVQRSFCRIRYASDFTDRMICAGKLFFGGVDSCQGDSGGPLVCNGTLAGLVSWGFGCAKRFSPGVYSNINDQRQWIDSFIDI